MSFRLPSQLAIFATLLLGGLCACGLPSKWGFDQGSKGGASGKKGLGVRAGVDFGEGFRGEPQLKEEHDNGLIVEDYVLGTGPEAVPGARLSLRSTGFVGDGTVFDDTRDPAFPPFRFELANHSTLAGWAMGLKGMKAGGKRKITVPPELAYGEKGKGVIGPNATLVFTVDLLEVKPPIARPRGAAAFEGEGLARKRLEKGLRITDYDLGEGDSVEMGDRVAVHFTGRVRGGAVFESSVASGAPFHFQVGDSRVIAGWNQGLVGMKVGGLRKIEIPASLGYGKRKVKNIPKNSKLVFTVELMKLEKVNAKAKPKAKPSM